MTTESEHSAGDSSPRTRRYFQVRRAPKGPRSLFSAHAEVFPMMRFTMRLCRTLLRARGGISAGPHPRHHPDISSPRTRRYFRYRRARGRPRPLFSAHAEVFPARQGRVPARRPLLRARGGISPLCRGPKRWWISSPRTRRYFTSSASKDSAPRLFSAHAEVFPAAAMPASPSEALLRARGGISVSPVCRALLHDSSPRTRRYFPFSVR